MINGSNYRVSGLRPLGRLHQGGALSPCLRSLPPLRWYCRAAHPSPRRLQPRPCPPRRSRPHRPRPSLPRRHLSRSGPSRRRPNKPRWGRRRRPTRRPRPSRSRRRTTVGCLPFRSATLICPTTCSSVRTASAPLIPAWCTASTSAAPTKGQSNNPFLTPPNGETAGCSRCFEHHASAKPPWAGRFVEPEGTGEAFGFLAGPSDLVGDDRPWAIVTRTTNRVTRVTCANEMLLTASVD